MLEREKKFFREVLHTCDDSQIQWILDHDYPEEEKELAKEEQNKRKSYKTKGCPCPWGILAKNVYRQG